MQEKAGAGCECIGCGRCMHCIHLPPSASNAPHVALGRQPDRQREGRCIVQNALLCISKLSNINHILNRNALPSSTTPSSASAIDTDDDVPYTMPSIRSFFSTPERRLPKVWAGIYWASQQLLTQGGGGCWLPIWLLFCSEAPGRGGQKAQEKILYCYLQLRGGVEALICDVWDLFSFRVAWAGAKGHHQAIGAVDR